MSMDKLKLITLQRDCLERYILRMTHITSAAEHCLHEQAAGRCPFDGKHENTQDNSYVFPPCMANMTNDLSPYETWFPKFLSPSKNDVDVKTEDILGYHTIHLTIKSETTGHILNSSPGEYSYIFTGRIDRLDPYGNPADCVSKVLERYLSSFSGGTLLICGIGNRNVKVDSLGPATIDRMPVYRIEQSATHTSRFSKVVTLIPGVFGKTNIKTNQHIMALANEINASCVLTIDSNEIDNLYGLARCVTIERSYSNDSDIPIIKLAIPTSYNEDGSAAVANDMTLTVIDSVISYGAKLLAYATLRAIYPDLTLDDIFFYCTFPE